jgi:hypothetical protein
MEVQGVSWRKSSYSSNGGDQCVEVGSDQDAVLVRDTKQHGRGQIHAFTAREWRAFVASVKAVARLQRDGSGRQRHGAAPARSELKLPWGALAY